MAFNAVKLQKKFICLDLGTRKPGLWWPGCLQPYLAFDFEDVLLGNVGSLQFIGLFFLLAQIVQ